MIYSFDTSDLQESALTYHRETVNRERAAAVPPLATFEDNEAYVADFVAREIINPLVSAYNHFRAQKNFNAYLIASDADRKIVDAALSPKV